MAIGARQRSATGTEKPEIAQAVLGEELTDVVTRLKLIEFDDDFVTDQDITADGVQWSPSITSGAIDTYVDVLVKKFDPGLTGNIQKRSLGLTAEFKTLNATTTLTWQWQGSDDNATWVDLHPAVLESPAAVATFEKTIQGAIIVSNFSKVPFWVKLRFKTSEANQGQARVKSSSYASYRFEVV